MPYISYNGFDETRIHGWLILPVFLKQERYPCLIHYHGFTGDRGYRFSSSQVTMLTSLHYSNSQK